MKSFSTWIAVGVLGLLCTGCASTQQASRDAANAPQLAMEETSPDPLGWTVRPISDMP